MNGQIDGASGVMCAATVAGGVFQTITQSQVLFILTVITGITTVAYNVLKIRNELRNKKNEK